MEEKKNNNKKFIIIIIGVIITSIICVIAIVALLAAGTFVAINPAQNFADTRDTQRQSDVQQILNAITQYTSRVGNSIEDFGEIPNCNDAVVFIGTLSGTIDLSILEGEYIVEVPKDPQYGTDATTGYDICLTSGDRVKIIAPHAENGVIEVSR